MNAKRLTTTIGMLLSAAMLAQGQSKSESQPAAAPKQLLYMPMEEKQLVAIPAQGVDVTLKGTPSFSEGKQGKALAIDSEGVSVSQVELKGRNLIDPQRGTIAFWMRPLLAYDGLDRHSFLTMTCAGNANYAQYVYIEKDGAFCFQTRKEGNKWADAHFNFKWWNKPTWTPGVWYHLAIAWGPDLPTIFYVNGAKIHEQPKETNLGFAPDVAQVDRIVVGANATGTQQANALLDELAVYGDVLTEVQVKALMAK